MSSPSSRFTQDELYKITRTTSWACWGLAIVGSVMRTVNFIPNKASLIIIVFMGLGIFFSLSLSRFKLAVTMREVFLAGLSASTALAGGTEARLRETHRPTMMREDSIAEVCKECAHRWPCHTIRILDGEEIEQALTEAKNTI